MVDIRDVRAERYLEEHDKLRKAGFQSFDQLLRVATTAVKAFDTVFPGAMDRRLGQVRIKSLGRSLKEKILAFPPSSDGYGGRWRIVNEAMLQELLAKVDELESKAKKAEEQRDDLFQTLVDVCKNERERHEDDSVCGLCEYDGAYCGESGDWLNECPGFETNECFCMKEEYCKKWGQPFKPYGE